MDKFIIPDKHFPRTFDQKNFDCCVAVTLTRMLEVWLCETIGKYINLSVGYVYGRNQYKGKRNGGMSIDYTLPLMCKERGTVPEDKCDIIDEVPEIINRVSALPNINELDELASHIKFKSFERLKTKNNKEMFDKAKKWLDEQQMPLIGIIYRKSINHCIMIVGYDDKENLLYIDNYGSNEIIRKKYTQFKDCYIAVGDTEEMQKYFKKEEKEEEDMPSFNLVKLQDIGTYISNVPVNRKVSLIQLHHTYSPSHKNFNGSNHLKLQQGMYTYHKSKGYVDIAQHFTVFPDGSIVTGRSLDTNPAGIYGANTGAICIECLGDFDTEQPTKAQQDGIIGLVKALMFKFKLTSDNIAYHCWYRSDGYRLGDYVKGQSCKTCPGANFFGGNTREAFNKNLKPLLEEYSMKEVTSINDIVWELTNAKIVTDGKLWLKKCEEDINVYWLCRKMANRLRGIK